MFPGYWILEYTDGSATNTVANGGAGVLIHIPEEENKEYKKATGKHCTNYSAEIQALTHAAENILKLESDCSQVVFLTDAKSTLEALENDKLPQLSKKLQCLTSFCRVVLQWIPAHCGIPGNETADKLAKEGARATQEEKCISYEEKKTLIKAALRSPPNTKDPYHFLEREQQTMIMRLRTGHCRLRSHLHRKFKLSPSPNCSCGDEETPEHVLQVCPRYSKARNDTWPVATSMHSKLFGSRPREELQKTTSFLKQTGLTI